MIGVAVPLQPLYQKPQHMQYAARPAGPLGTMRPLPCAQRTAPRPQGLGKQHRAVHRLQTATAIQSMPRCRG